jgi:hypothetical protein
LATVSTPRSQFGLLQSILYLDSEVRWHWQCAYKRFQCWNPLECGGGCRDYPSSSCSNELGHHPAPHCSRPLSSPLASRLLRAPKPPASILTCLGGADSCCRVTSTPQVVVESTASRLFRAPKPPANCSGPLSSRQLLAPLFSRLPPPPDRP